MKNMSKLNLSFFSLSACRSYEIKLFIDLDDSWT
jgi:hypothetical protein